MDYIDVHVSLSSYEINLLLNCIDLIMNSIEDNLSEDELFYNEEYHDYDFLAYYLNSYLKKIQFLKRKIKEKEDLT